MYTKRIQLINYGPVEKLDIEFPFDGETPMPVVLVGENGSGKSILLSHLVNGLLKAKDSVYPATPEVEPGRVYKLKTNFYIKSGSHFSFARVDFEEGWFDSEITTMRLKQEYSEAPTGIVGSAAESMWKRLEPVSNDHSDSNFNVDYATFNRLKGVIGGNCILYFPFNRFEDPAWLNKDNLMARAQFAVRKRLVDHTSRQAIALSPLHENQDWLFDVIYDKNVKETRTVRVPIPMPGDASPWVIEAAQTEPLKNAESIHKIALKIVQRVLRDCSNASFRIGRRHNRFLALHGDDGTIVPNIFQLSSGETSLLNIFLSILRDFEWSASQFSDSTDVRGVVIVDEIDLHLHAIHQYEVLPRLITLFPKVQFILTTHSPLFVLGMQKAFGEDGFGLYHLPQGDRISSEEFSEFGEAYSTFSLTRRYLDDVRTVIEQIQKPIVFVEGATDKRYIEKASILLEKKSILESLEIRDGGGSGKLAKIWKDSVLPLTETLPYQVLLLFDCETGRDAASKGKLLQRSIPMQGQNPIKKGIENLFSKSTLAIARQHEPAFFITEEEHGGTDEKGQPVTIPEKWAVNDSEKSNLCDWLCENGTAEDFKHFDIILSLMEEVLDAALSDHRGGKPGNIP